MDNFLVILVVRDGWGYSEMTKGNAIYLANTPNNDRYMNYYPWTLLKCTGNAVGLPKGTQGGSEPGHITMGAGRVVWQPLKEIDMAIIDGNFYRHLQSFTYHITNTYTISKIYVQVKSFSDQIVDLQ